MNDTQTALESMNPRLRELFDALKMPRLRQTKAQEAESSKIRSWEIRGILEHGVEYQDSSAASSSRDGFILLCALNHHE